MSNVNRKGSITGSQISDIEAELSIYRNGQRVEIDGSWNFVEFLNGFSISETITNASIQASFVLTDAMGMCAVLTGSESWKFTLKTDHIDRTQEFYQ